MFSLIEYRLDTNGRRELLKQGLNYCNVCRSSKPLEDFHVHAGMVNGRMSVCIPCHKKKQRATWKRFKFKRKRARIAKIYGLDDIAYEQLLKQQNNCCAICGKPEVECKRKLAVDHCHVTGRVRGLLCNRCNLGIAHFNDNIEFLQSAIKYLQ